LIDLLYNPTTMVTDQTALCNQSCSFCWRSNSGAVASKMIEFSENDMPVTLPFKLYTKMIDLVAQVRSVNRLSLCGPLGDPLIVDDLAWRGEYAMKTRRFTEYVLINTNGVALEKHDLEKLLRSFTRICFSVDAVDPVIYGKIHGKENQCLKVLKNIAAAIEKASELEFIGKKCAEIWVRFTEGEHNKGHFSEFSRFFSGVRKRIKIVHKKEHAFVDVMPEKATRDGAVLCNQPQHNINFSAIGDLTTCCINHKGSPAFGNIRDMNTVEDLQAAWEGNAFAQWRQNRFDGLCKDCSGLGGFMQRPGGVMSENEKHRLERIRKYGAHKVFSGSV